MRFLDGKSNWERLCAKTRKENTQRKKYNNLVLFLSFVTFEFGSQQKYDEMDCMLTRRLHYYFHKVAENERVWSLFACTQLRRSNGTASFHLKCITNPKVAGESQSWVTAGA